MPAPRTLSFQNQAGLAWNPVMPPVVPQGQTAVPLALSEVTRLSVRLPYVIERKGKKLRVVVPLDLLAERGAQFVDPSGLWASPFIPFALLRGPFEARLQDKGALITVDHAALVPQDDAAIALFDAGGAMHPMVKEHVKRLAAWRASLKAVEDAAQALGQAGVLKPIHFGDEPWRYAYVDEKQLLDLPERVAGKLLATGALKLAYGQITSLTTMNSIRKVTIETESGTKDAARGASGNTAAALAQASDPEADDYLAALREGFE